MQNKIKAIKGYLNSKFMEREEIIDGMFVGLIARQHTLLIGSPGTAKSNLAVEFSKQIDGLEYFQWLLTKFSNPEELFGSINIPDYLDKGIYKRDTKNKLPEAHLAFLDEIFKSNSAMLNALLTLINERIFYNDSAPVKSPLISVIGSSNEYPEEGEGLEALFDRFLLRYEVNNIKGDSNFLTLLKNDTQYLKEPDKLTLDEISQLQMFADMVDIPDDVLNALLTIRNELQQEGIRPSDRRFKQALSIIKAQAVIDNRSVAQVKDIMILQNGLWETVDQKSKTIEIVEHHAADRCKIELERIEKAAQEIYEAVKADSSAELGMEGTTKLKESLTDLGKLERNYSERSAEIQVVREKILTVQSQIGAALLGI